MNVMSGCWLLRWWRNVSICVDFRTQKVSSTNRFHMLGGSIKVESAVVSSCSMKMLAVKPDVEAPMARPCFCA